MPAVHALTQRVVLCVDIYTQCTQTTPLSRALSRPLSLVPLLSRPRARARSHCPALSRARARVCSLSLALTDSRPLSIALRICFISLPCCMCVHGAACVCVCRCLCLCLHVCACGCASAPAPAHVPMSVSATVHLSAGIVSSLAALYTWQETPNAPPENYA